MQAYYIFFHIEKHEKAEKPRKSSGFNVQVQPAADRPSTNNQSVFSGI